MRHLFALLVILGLRTPLTAAEQRLEYVAAPADNPLKGLVPYAGPSEGRFPHSMEFRYLPLSDLMLGPNEFQWEPLEKVLNDIAARGHQTIFRIWLEYPGHEEGIPKFLEQQGLQVTEWWDKSSNPSQRRTVRTPDYNNPHLRKGLQAFIRELGKKYDGDPRIGYITAGLLGAWGEWHTHPRSELMASKEVQAEVMDAYEQAFQKTPILLRYPAGEKDQAHAANHQRRFGYHDDSFAWATLDTGRKEDNWFFLSTLKSAGPEGVAKWKTSPIGGEIRPELWGQIFDDQPKHKQAQDFAECVRQTHVTWLMDSGMFAKNVPEGRRRNAIAEVRKMGYEFHIESVEKKTLKDGSATLTIQLRNTGVAPFYHQWKVELATTQGDQIVQPVPIDWTVANLLPETKPRLWTVEIAAHLLTPEVDGLALRIANPLPHGHPLRFANKYPETSPAGWWRLPQ